MAKTVRSVVLIGLISGCLASASMAQAVSVNIAPNAPAGQTQMQMPPELQKYPGLLPEFGQLLGKFQHDIQFPAPRSQSRLLPLVPESTIFYVALPNYGDTSHQALTIFHRELDQSAVLRDWWQHEMVKDGPKIEDAIQKFSQLSDYLGNEIVLGVTSDDPDPEVLLVTEAKKPGLKDFLQKISKDLPEPANSHLRIVDAQELAAATAGPRKDGLSKDGLSKDGLNKEFVILVRPDFIAAASDLVTLRQFNARLEKNSGDFASSTFGRRVAQVYEGGATTVLAADLEQILKKIPLGSNRDTLERTGFSDVKYLVSSHSMVPGQSSGQMELSFTGPRHGVASWLASPGPMGSLEFVSPKAALAGSIRLANPADIFEDVRDLATVSNPNAFAGLTQMERGLGLSLKGDLLSRLTGEVTYEVDSFTPPNPVWKAILGVNDAEHVQMVLTRLLVMAPVNPTQSVEDGITYHILHIPAGQKTTEIAYAFADGYWIIGSSRATVAEGVRLHRSGESLAKSQKFLASLPAGKSSNMPADMSALFYEQPGAMAAMTMRQAPPEFAALFSNPSADVAPIVVSLYGEESAVRMASRSSGFDASMLLMGAAVAIPNLLRARIAANESSAIASIRTVNVAQVTYSSTYPDRGFAQDLARLGPDPSPAGKASFEHANLIDATLINPACAAGTGCEKNGFRFNVTTVCTTKRCGEYVVTGTPVSSSTGTKNFCSTSDAVVRSKAGDPISSPITAAECRTWTPVGMTGSRSHSAANR
jgi:hypothetical protein